MRIMTTVFSLLLVYVSTGCKTGYDLETDTLTRVTMNKSDTIFQFHTINSTEINYKVKETDYFYWFRADTILMTRGGFDGKLLHGEYKSFYPNKNLKESGRFEYGLKIDEWKSWHSNGELQTVSIWHAGKKDGKFQEFTQNGQKLRTGKYKSDKLSGYIITYAGDTVANKLLYRNGQPVIKEKKNDTGKKKSQHAAQK